MQIPKYKIVLLGDQTVGKTSIRRRYMGETFRTEYVETLGADFALKKVKIPNPNTPEEAPLRQPNEILKAMASLDKESLDIMSDLKLLIKND